MLIWVNHPGKADVAIPPAPNGVSIEPGSDATNVRMVSETVTMDVASYSDQYQGVATVTAVFHMRNLRQTEERMDARFPLYANEKEEVTNPYDHPPLEDFSVEVGGIFLPVTYTQIELPMIIPDGEWIMQTIRTWANFPVIFPSGKDVTITVHYLQPGDVYLKNSNPNYVKFSYLLANCTVRRSTGVVWNGPSARAADPAARFSSCP